MILSSLLLLLLCRFFGPSHALSSPSSYDVGNMGDDAAAVVRRNRHDVCVREMCSNASATVCAGESGIDVHLKCISFHKLSDYIVNIFYHRFDWLTFDDVIGSEIFDSDTITWHATSHLMNRVRWDARLEGRLFRITTRHEVYLVRYFGVDPSYHDERHASTTTTTSTTSSPTTAVTTTQPPSSTLQRYSSTRRVSTTTIGSASTSTVSGQTTTRRQSSTASIVTSASRSVTQSTSRSSTVVHTSSFSRVPSTARTLASTTVSVSTRSPPRPPVISIEGYSLGVVLASLFGGIVSGLLLFPVARVALQTVMMYRRRRRSVDLFYIPPSIRVVDAASSNISPVLDADGVYEPTF